MNNIILIFYFVISILLFIGLFKNTNHNFKEHKKFKKWQKVFGFFIFGGLVLMWPITLMVTFISWLYSVISKKIIKD